MDSGVARRPIADRRLCRSARPLRIPLRLCHESRSSQGEIGDESVIYARGGEDERVLRAAQVILEEGVARHPHRRQVARNASSASASP